jgi:hypothetical protein
LPLAGKQFFGFGEDGARIRDRKSIKRDRLDRARRRKCGRRRERCCGQRDELPAIDEHVGFPLDGAYSCVVVLSTSQA